MSIQAVGWALEQDLPARPKLVLVSLANHADHTTGYCWLKAETLAREAACTTRSIYRFIGGLVRNGYIRKAPRKGEDGKQRANDYWIMFGREEKHWDWGAHPEPPEPEDDPEENATDGDETQDVVEPYDTASHGEHVGNSPADPVDKHAVSHGPCDSRVSHSESLEPSKTNSKKDAREAPFSLPPRAYRPPPPSVAADVQGAILADREAKLIFVYVGTRAWDAWMAEMSRRKGFPWRLSTTAVIDGKTRQGWYFPTLFPPAPPSTAPPVEED